MQMLEGLQQQLQEASAQRSKAEDYANSIKVSAGIFQDKAGPFGWHYPPTDLA